MESKNATMVKTRDSRDLERDMYTKRRQRAQGKGFKTMAIKYKSKRPALYRLVRTCCSMLISYYLNDALKAPMNNAAKSALFSKPSYDIYLGINISKIADVIKRTAYGTGSGAASIGLNPEEMRVYSCFPELVQLLQEATNIVKENDKWKHRMKDKEFNFVSVKIYFSYRDKNGNLIKKHTNWHVDVTSERDGTPCSNNSQEPNTPVAMFTFGEEKNLWFRQHTTKTQYYSDSVFNFRQQSGSLIILDPRDEMLGREGRHWRHMSEMLKDRTEGGVTFSLMCRVVQTTIDVNATDSSIVDKTLGVREKKIAVFRRARNVMKTQRYKKDREHLSHKFTEVFRKFKA